MNDSSPTTSATRKAVLEVCVGSVTDAELATEAGANRLELCSALELGGLTPSIGLVKQVLREFDLPVVVMIRPRAAGFAYGEREVECMLADAAEALAAGAQGIVFGSLTTEGQIDVTVAEQFVDVAGKQETVFHRAFDWVGCPEAAVEELAKIGVTRVLTSGSTERAQRAAALKRLVEQAAGRLEVLAGGGVKASEACSLLRYAGCSGIHIGAACDHVDLSIPPAAAAALCDSERIVRGVGRAVDGSLVARTRCAIDSGAADGYTARGAYDPDH